MTTGTQISDARTNVTGDCGPALVGSYFSRTWSGGDSPDGDRTIPHAYNCTRYSSYNPEIRWRTKSPLGAWKTGSVVSCFGTENVPIINWTSNDELKLIGKASKKVRKNGFNGDAFIAEGHQMLSLISTTARRLAGFLDAVRDGNIYKAAHYLGGPSSRTGKNKIIRSLKRELTPNGKSTGSLANAILEVQYGWRPLLKDAHEFGTALGSILTKVPTQSYRVQRKLVSEAELGVYHKFYCLSTRRVRYIITVEEEPMTRQILHLNDPLAAAWELTPWSFVADWFLPISDYLEALNFYRELKIKQIVRTDVHTRRSLFKGSTIEEILGGEQFFTKSVVIARTLPAITANPYSDIPIPQLKTLRQSLSPEHCLNGIALLMGSANGFTKSLKF